MPEATGLPGAASGLGQRHAFLWALAFAALTVAGSLLAVDLEFVRFSMAPFGVFLAGLALLPAVALGSQLLYLSWTVGAWIVELGAEGLLRPEIAHAFGFCFAAWLVSRGKSAWRLSSLGKSLLVGGGAGFAVLSVWLMQEYPHLAMILFAALVVALMVYFGKTALRFKFWLMASAVFGIHVVSIPLLLVAAWIWGNAELETIFLYGVAVHIPGQLLMALIATRLAYDFGWLVGLDREALKPSGEG